MDEAARLAVLEVRVAELGREQERTRDRLHTLGAEQAAVTLLAQRIADLPAAMTNTAKQAAREAVELALNERDEREDERREFLLKLSAVCISFGGLAVGLASWLLA